MKKIRLGFIGCGKHAFRSHAQVAFSMPEMFSVTAAFDTNPEAIDKFTELFPLIYIAKSARDLINNPNVDAVIIATPHEFHFDLLRKSVNARRHVLCEKPLWVGDKTEDVRSIIKEAMEYDIVVTSCHPRRFGLGYISLRNNLSKYETEYGRLSEVNFRFFYHKPTTEWKKSDSLLLDHMNHEIDVVNFILGREPVYLECMDDSYNHYHVFGHRNDLVRLCFSGYRRLESHIFVNEIELIFPRGRVKVKETLSQGVVKTVETREDFDRGFFTSHEYDDHSYDTVFRDVMSSFGNTILGLEKNYLDPEDLIENTASCNTLIESGKYSSIRIK